MGMPAGITTKDSDDQVVVNNRQQGKKSQQKGYVFSRILPTGGLYIPLENKPNNFLKEPPPARLIQGEGLYIPL